MDPFSAFMAFLGPLLGAIGRRNQNDTQGQRERVPFTNAEGQWQDLNTMIKTMMAQAQQNLNSPIDLPHTGVPELEGGRGRSVPDYLKPGAQRRVKSTLDIGDMPSPAGSLVQGGDTTAQQQWANRAGGGGTTATDAANTDTTAAGDNPMMAASIDPFTISQQLTKILGDTMGRSESPSRISATMGSDIGNTGMQRRKPTSPPQTYGAAQLLLHALNPNGAGNGAGNPFAMMA